MSVGYSSNTFNDMVTRLLVEWSGGAKQKLLFVLASAWRIPAEAGAPGHRIEATGVPRMTAANSAQPQKSTAPQAVQFNSFVSIAGTGWIKAA